MALDPQTLLFSMLSVVLLTAGACLLTWLEDRRQSAMLWMAAASVLCGGGATARALLPFVPANVVGTSTVLAGLGLIWSACRTLRDQPSRPALIILPSVIWLGVFAVPGFREDVGLRILLACLLSLAPLALAARELWQIGRRLTLIRWSLLVLLGLQSALTLGRVVNLVVLGHVQHVASEALPGFVPVMIDSFSFILLFSFGMIALVKERSERRLYDAARTDPVTGVAVRRYFEESLHRQFLLACKSRQALGLIMIDVDDFKAYNDSYGHPAGDRCLNTIARALAACSRPTDMVGRYGGEEFAILLPETDRRAAFAIAERMRLRISALRIAHARQSQAMVTISLGAAALVPWLGEATPEELVKMADRALYLAKETGRNRTCLAPAASDIPFSPGQHLDLGTNSSGSAPFPLNLHGDADES